MHRVSFSSAAYQVGFEQSFTGRDGECPCAGNPVAEHNYNIGRVNGRAANRKGFESFEAYHMATFGNCK